jgi:hypothetical protein
MFPDDTPPNAIVFGVKILRVVDMVRLLSDILIVVIRFTAIILTVLFELKLQYSVLVFNLFLLQYLLVLCQNYFLD